jgi:hypothetical protein
LQAVLFSDATRIDFTLASGPIYYLNIGSDTTVSTEIPEEGRRPKECPNVLFYRDIESHGWGNQWRMMKINNIFLRRCLHDFSAYQDNHDRLEILLGIHFGATRAIALSWSVEWLRILCQFSKHLNSEFRYAKNWNSQFHFSISLLFQ